MRLIISCRGSFGIDISLYFLIVIDVGWLSVVQVSIVGFDFIFSKINNQNTDN